MVVRKKDTTVELRGYYDLETPQYPLHYVSTISDELITSSPHPGWRNATWKQDRGGPFEAVKREFLSPWWWPATWNDYFGRAGGFIAPYNANNGGFPEAKGLPTSKLRELGTIAISTVAPTVPRSAVQTAVAELKEGLPKITGLAHTKGFHPASAGEEYLNYSFGIAPTISDFKKTYNVVKNADKLWEQYERNSGKLRRKRFTFPPQVEVGEPYTYTSWWQPGYFIGSNATDVTIQDVTTRRLWFSGAFVYYVPTDTFGKARSKLRYLYGVGIEEAPNTVWNLIGYSWLADWAFNIGDVITNVSAFLSDGLVMPYGYLMEETTTVRAVNVKLRSVKAGLQPSYDLVMKTTRKKRIKASPFGFNIEWPDLSARRLAILASLGVTRASH